jgi:hypothetical protein
VTTGHAEVIALVDDYLGRFDAPKMAEDWPRREKLGELAGTVKPGDWVDLVQPDLVDSKDLPRLILLPTVPSPQRVERLDQVEERCTSCGVLRVG